MKILLLNKYHYLKGGSESVYFNTAHLLRENGHEVIHFALKNNKNEPSPTANYFVDMPELKESGLKNKLKNIPSFFYNRQAAKNLDKLIRDHKPDIAHINLLFNGLSLSILPVLKKHNIPVVMSVHDYRLLCRSSSFMMKKECETCNTNFKLLTNSIKYVCSGNSRLENFLLAMESFEKEHLITHHKYINKYIFISKYQQNIHKLKRSFFTNENSVQLYNFLPNIDKLEPDRNKGDYYLFYGRINKEKGVRTVIEAAAKLPNKQFKIAGAGELEEELKKTATANVQFLGFRKGTELNNIIKKASFVIVPSEWQEVMGLVVIEAMALGKPVIGSRIGGIPELIEEGKSGFLFEQANVDDLIKSINKSDSISADDYVKMSNFAHNIACKNFNQEKHYSELISIYGQALAKS